MNFNAGERVYTMIRPLIRAVAHMLLAPPRLTVLAAILTVGACAPVIQPAPEPVQPAKMTLYAAIMPDGARLPLTRWLPEQTPRAAVVALHGFNDHSGAFDDLGAALADTGVAVYAYDQRGFGGAPGRGLWPGSGTMAGDFIEVARLVRAAHPGIPVYALGESMGGAVIMTAMAAMTERAPGAEPPPIAGAILSAPAVWGRRTMPGWQSGTLDALAHLIPMIRLRPQGLNFKPSDNIEMLRALGRDPRFIRETRIDAIHGLVDLMDEALESAPALDLPLLVLYGERDEIVPRAPTCLMLSRLPVTPGGRRWRVALYPDGYHMLFRDLAGDLVTRDIAAWLLDPKATLPAGHERRPEPASPNGTGNPLPGFCDTGAG